MVFVSCVGVDGGVREGELKGVGYHNACGRILNGANCVDRYSKSFRRRTLRWCAIHFMTVII